MFGLLFLLKFSERNLNLPNRISFGCSVTYNHIIVIMALIYLIDYILEYVMIYKTLGVKGINYYSTKNIVCTILIIALLMDLMNVYLPYIRVNYNTIKQKLQDIDFDSIRNKISGLQIMDLNGTKRWILQNWTRWITEYDLTQYNDYKNDLVNRITNLMNTMENCRDYIITSMDNLLNNRITPFMNRANNIIDNFINNFINNN